jgi:hypothetical protein
LAVEGGRTTPKGQSGVAEATHRPTWAVQPPFMAWPATLGFLKYFLIFYYFNFKLFLKNK